MVTEAQRKIRELTVLLPETLRDDVTFRADGFYVWMFIAEPVPETVRLLVKYNQASYGKDETSGRIGFQFPVEHPTCDKDGKALNFEHGTDTIRMDREVPEETPPEPPLVVEVQAVEKPRLVTPIEIINAREKQTQQPQPKHLTPIADYGACFCSSCINPNNEQIKPCSEQQQCATCKTPLLLNSVKEQQKIIIDQQKSQNDYLETVVESLETLTKILQVLTQTPPLTVANSVANTPTLGTQKTPDQQPPKTTTPTTTTATATAAPTPQPVTPTLTTTKPTHNVDKEEYKQRQTKEKQFFVKDGIIWVKSETSTKKTCDKAYLHKNLGKDGKATPEYKALPCTAGSHNGVWWLMSDPLNPQPYKARMTAERSQ
jgi:hypothetical protein